MIPKSVQRFSEKIMFRQKRSGMTLRSSVIPLELEGTEHHLSAFPVAIVPGEWPKAGAFAPHCGLLFPQFWQRASHRCVVR
ncbi:MAG TPA: hypothetical protein VK438_05350 [Xanthobacteraceae bacterium]|nr:hypothetical protein [Xanthobacteraceae bacterium]